MPLETTIYYIDVAEKEMKEKSKGGTYMDYINYLRNMVGHEK